MGAFSHITFAAKSDVGRKRKNNEDSFGVFPSVGVFCVADGMGGGDDGEVASAATVRAIETFAKNCPSPTGSTFSSVDIVSSVRSHLNDASSWILRRAKEKHLKGCGSTFVGVCFDAARPDAARALHAGDSRLYRIRGRSIQQITKDHSAAELIGAKNDSDVNPMFRGMILRAVGIQSTVEIEETDFSLKEGDRILICSDGLSRMIPDKRILSIVRSCGSVGGAVDELIGAANAAGGLDNVTVVLLEVGELPAALPVVEMPLVMKQASNGGPKMATDEATQDTNDEEESSFEMSSEDTFSVAEEFPGDTDANATVTCTTVTGSDVPDGEAGCAESHSVRRRMLLVTCAVLVLVGVSVGFVLKWKADSRREAEAQRLAEIRRVAEADRKAAESARLNAELEAKRRAEAEAERLRIAEEKRRAEQLKRQERERQEKEAAVRFAQLLREREAREEARLAAERQAKRDAEAAAARERERVRIASETAAKAKAAAEAARVEEERRLAEKRRQEIEAKRQAEAARLESARRVEAARRRELKRMEVLQAFEPVCEDVVVDAFVEKLSELITDDMPETLRSRARFQRLKSSSALSQEEKLAAAVDLTRDVQTAVDVLTEYAKAYQEDLLADTLPEGGVRKGSRAALAHVRSFMEKAGQFTGRDPSDPETQVLCILMIGSVPRWF